MPKIVQKLQSLYQQLQEYLFYDDYRKRKDTLETKKCRNCLRRVGIHWDMCPWCNHSDFSFNEEYLYRKTTHEPDGKPTESVSP